MQKVVVDDLLYKRGHVVVGSPHPRRSISDTNSPVAATKGPKDDKNISESLSDESMRNLLRFHADVLKSNISLGFNRLLKGFKNIPQLFGEYKLNLIKPFIRCVTK
ncbi:hypothetical protein GmHk_10G029516 [Glycine max]|nr:hypothetical protein GmHk_10G029516 [Glycine max]